MRARRGARSGAGGAEALERTLDGAAGRLVGLADEGGAGVEGDLKDEAKALAFRDDFIGTEIYLSGKVKRNSFFDNLEIIASGVEKVDVEKLIETLNA